MKNNILTSNKRNFLYAPGITTYGVDGKDGEKGNPGNSIFFTDFNLNDEDELKELSRRIANTQILLKNDNSILPRPYQLGDIILSLTGEIYELYCVDKNGNVIYDYDYVDDFNNTPEYKPSVFIDTSTGDIASVGVYEGFTFGELKLISGKQNNSDFEGGNIRYVGEISKESNDSEFFVPTTSNERLQMHSNYKGFDIIKLKEFDSSVFNDTDDEISAAQHEAAKMSLTSALADSADYELRVISDINEDNKIKLMTLISRFNNLQNEYFNIYFDTIDDCFHIESNKPILIDTSSLQLDIKNSAKTQFDNYSSLMTYENPITELKNATSKMCYQVTNTSIFDSDDVDKIIDNLQFVYSNNILKVKYNGDFLQYPHLQLLFNIDKYDEDAVKLVQDYKKVIFNKGLEPMISIKMFDGNNSKVDTYMINSFLYDNEYNEFCAEIELGKFFYNAKEKKFLENDFNTIVSAFIEKYLENVLTKKFDNITADDISVINLSDSSLLLPWGQSTDTSSKYPGIMISDDISIIKNGKIKIKFNQFDIKDEEFLNKYIILDSQLYDTDIPTETAQMEEYMEAHGSYNINQDQYNRGLVVNPEVAKSVRKYQKYNTAIIYDAKTRQEIDLSLNAHSEILLEIYKKINDVSVFTITNGRIDYRYKDFQDLLKKISFGKKALAIDNLRISNIDGISKLRMKDFKDNKYIFDQIKDKTNNITYEQFENMIRNIIEKVQHKNVASVSLIKNIECFIPRR